MNFLESVGCLTLFLLLGYLLLRLILRFLDKRSLRNKEDKLIIKYNKRINKILSDSEWCRKEGVLTIKDIRETNREIWAILNDPKIRRSTLQFIEQQKLNAQRLQYEDVQKNKELRKFAYQYDKIIFEIFDTNKDILEEDLLRGISRIYEIDLNESKQILNLWRNKHLIGRNMNEHYFITTVLTDPKYKLIDSDLTRNDWLLINNKVIER